MTELVEWAAEHAAALKGRKFVAIIPDLSRSGGEHVGDVLRGIYRARAQDFDEFIALIALGTHPPVSEDSIVDYLHLSSDIGEMPKLTFVNHSEDELRQVGHVSRPEWLEMSEGTMDLADFGLEDGVEVRFNRHAVEADVVCIIGPVLPHEVVGCSGGYKYLTPGIGGRELTGLTHWLGAVLTIPKIIGVVETPVRRVVEHCGKMLTGPDVFCVGLVVEDDELRTQFFGSAIDAHRRAAVETLKHNVEYVGRRYPRVVGCLAERYDELWTGGKASYKLIQIVEPGGELIIYAPHLHQVSATWGQQIAAVGYHSKSYINAHLRELLEQGISPAVLAHVTHVYGPGEYADGKETPSVVSLAAGFDEQYARNTLNLGYRDPNSIDLQALADDPDTYISANAGQRLVKVKGE